DLPTLGRPTTASTGVGPASSEVASTGASKSVMLLLGRRRRDGVVSWDRRGQWPRQGETGEVHGSVELGTHVLLEQQRGVVYLFPGAGPGTRRCAPRSAEHQVERGAARWQRPGRTPRLAGAEHRDRHDGRPGGQGEIGSAPVEPAQETVASRALREDP